MTKRGPFPRYLKPYLKRVLVYLAKNIVDATVTFVGFSISSFDQGLPIIPELLEPLEIIDLFYSSFYHIGNHLKCMHIKHNKRTNCLSLQAKQFASHQVNHSDELFGQKFILFLKGSSIFTFHDFLKSSFNSLCPKYHVYCENRLSAGVKKPFISECT